MSDYRDDDWFRSRDESSTNTRLVMRAKIRDMTVREVWLALRWLDGQMESLPNELALATAATQGADNDTSPQPCEPDDPGLP